MEKIEEIEKDMTPKLIEDLGMRYPTEKSIRKFRYGLFECQYCGKEFEAQSSNIKNKHTQSCGCLVFKKYGLSKHKFYNTWNGMLQRCNNTNSSNYKYYGSLGISVCEYWLKLENFLLWCDETYIEGYTLDRIDNDKGYSPENCRWVSKTTQIINQKIRNDNKSGYVGVYFNTPSKKWMAYITNSKERIHLGSYLTLDDAIQARDNYIIENNLPHKLST